MLSLDYVRKNKEKVVATAKNKNREIEIDKVIELDNQRRTLIQNIQSIREERNSLSKRNPDEKTIKRGKEIKDQLKTLEEKLKMTEQEIERLLSYFPNIPLEEVPIGKDATGNIELRTWGNPPKFNFPPRSFIELGKQLDLVDLERGAKVSGFRGYFLKNQAAILQTALMFYVLKKLVTKGYIPLIAPAIVKGFTLFGSGHLPWGIKELYRLNDEDMYLSATAEIPVTAYHAGEILLEKDLPKKYVAFSPCFRSEAGAHGKDTKGLYRVHEFWKIEQVIIGKNDLDEARILHEELQKNAEEILQDLELPYRVLLMCTGDMGEPQIKKYDTETWMPSRNAYGETMSNSIMGEFQTRRLKIKYRKPTGETQYCYSFNNTAVASPRILIAILENYQQMDGSILVPKVLQGLVEFKKITAKN